MSVENTRLDIERQIEVAETECETLSHQLKHWQDRLKALKAELTALED